MKARQLKAAAASLLVTAATATIILVTTGTQANAWPCFPRCGTPMPSTSVVPSVSPHGLVRR